jgi:hypothetical protein
MKSLGLTRVDLALAWVQAMEFAYPGEGEPHGPFPR